jgi:hypothetical protein
MLELQNKRQHNVIIDNDHRNRSWISLDTWKLIDGKSEACRVGNIVEKVRLKKLLRKALQKDRKIRAENAAEEIETLLVNGNIREAFEIIRQWHKTQQINHPFLRTWMPKLYGMNIKYCIHDSNQRETT